jgi:hypothetical protein
MLEIAVGLVMDDGRSFSASKSLKILMVASWSSIFTQIGQQMENHTTDLKLLCCPHTIIQK